MAKPTRYIPQHCHRKPTGQGYVRLNGKAFHTGIWAHRSPSASTTDSSRSGSREAAPPRRLRGRTSTSRMILDIQRRYGDTTEAVPIVREFADRFWNQEWPGNRRPEVSYDPRSVELSADRRASMHAKCIVVDEARCLVTSAHLTEAAQERNYELGVLVDSQVLASSIVDQFATLASAGLLLRLPGSAPQSPEG